MTEKTQIIITAKDETRAAFKSAESGLDSLKKSADKLKETFSSNIRGGIAAFLVGGGAVAAIKSTIDDLDALNLSAERLGVSAAKLETINFAGKLAGLEADDVEKALVKVSVKLEEAAAGSKEAIAWFEKLGVTWLDAAGKVKTADQAFLDISDKISDMADGTGKVSILVDGFGEKLGRKLAPALNSGAEGFKALRKEAEQLGGGSYNLDELARQADAFNDNLDKLAFASKAAGRGLANELLPSLVDTSQAMVDLIREGNGALAILRGIAGIGKIPFDIVLGSSKADLSVDKQVADLKSKLARLEDADKSFGTGIVSKLLYGDKEQRARDAEVLRNQIGALEKFKDKIEAKPEVKDTRERGGLPTKEEKPKRTGGGGAAKIDEAERLIASLNEQIALKAIDAESTDKMTAAEQQRARVLYQIDAGTLKVTASQREKIAALLDEAVALDKTLQAQKEFADGVKRLDEANARARQSLIEQAAAAEEAAATYGLSATAINSTVEARLEEAIAVANANGAYPEQIAYLEEELALRQQLTGALEKNDLARLLANTKTAKDAKTAADVATLDRALSSGKINKDQYDEAMDNIKEKFDEMGEFAKEAARNMQDAFADFLFDPFSQGLDKALYKFVQTIQRMAAEAVAANILKALFGDMGKTGKVTGLVGSFITALGFHEGGVVGEPVGASFTRAVPASLFANARRYHTGGIAGDEVPAILKKGEMVLTQEQQRGMVAAPAPAQPQNIRIINAFDQSVIGDYLGSAAGERIIMNAVQRNASAMRQALA